LVNNLIPFEGTNVNFNEIIAIHWKGTEEYAGKQLSIFFRTVDSKYSKLIKEGKFPYEGESDWIYVKIWLFCLDYKIQYNIELSEKETYIINLEIDGKPLPSLDRIIVVNTKTQTERHIIYNTKRENVQFDPEFLKLLRNNQIKGMSLAGKVGNNIVVHFTTGDPAKEFPYQVELPIKRIPEVKEHYTNPLFIPSRLEEYWN